jgi:phospholipid/cholesterol/gamma-HCH transport system substrate-binding protein
MDTKAILRQKTLLGETYVELTPGSSDESLSAAGSGTTPPSGTIPEGGTLPEAQVSDAVQLDEIFRTFDEPTRANFQAWMQGQAAALRGRGDDLSLALASLDPFAEEADRALRVLDSQSLAVRQLVRDGGEVFQALSERRGQLRGLISNSNQVFATTAARDQDLAETFRIFPTFLRESRTTLTRLDEFAQDTDPLVQQLRPAAAELTPTLIDLGRLAPDLEAFFRGFRGTINAGRTGLPATRKLLDDDLRPLLARLDPYLADFNSIFEGVGLYKHEVAAFLGNVAAATNGIGSEGPESFRHLRTEAPLGPETLAAYPRRLQVNRTNPYVAPDGYDNLATGLESFETRHCATGVDATLDPADAGAFPGNLLDRTVDFAYADIPLGAGGVYHADDLPTPPCNQQADFDSIGVFPEQTQYLHVREEP